MKVLLDARKWQDGGIGVMIQLLAIHFSRKGVEVHTIVREEDAKEIYEITKIQPIVSHVKPYSLTELFEIGKIANQSKVDVVYIPHYTVPFFCKKPIVSIIHDTIQIQFPDQFSLIQRIYARWMIAWALYRSDAVVTQSETVRKDLIERFSWIQKDKIHSILRIPDLRWNEPIYCQTAHRLPKPYCLYYGAYRKHKNIQFLIRLWEKHPDLPVLVIAGDRLSKYPALQHDLQKLLKDRRCIDLGLLSFSDLRIIVRESFCVLLPSKYEGFGATPLEAMMLNVPAIVSNRGALPESAGYGAIVLPLENEEEWYFAIQSLQDTTHRNYQITQGQSWLKTFQENQWVDKQINICMMAVEKFGKTKRFL
ncbi:MAG: glycosyltransferase family 4 protein [bacterium]|nr:glycosyltransferase family 4 protein [bacterium]